LFVVWQQWRFWVEWIVWYQWHDWIVWYQWHEWIAWYQWHVWNVADGGYVDVWRQQLCFVIYSGHVGLAMQSQQ